jgi:Kelch motif protein
MKRLATSFIMLALLGTLSPANAASGWGGPAPLSVGHFGHGAILLSPGKVLVVGGSGHVKNPSTGSMEEVVVAEAELFDATSGRWTRAADMSTARAYGAFTKLKDGRVLAAGGYNPHATDPYLSSTEIFDPATNHWSEAASMSDWRTSFDLTTLADGRVLAIGKQPPEIYDPAANNWKTAAPMAYYRSGYETVRLNDGSVLVIGGCWGGVAGTTSERYDPLRNEWTIQQMNANHCMGGATLLSDGRVLVSGGGWQDPAESRIAEVFDPKTRRWTRVADMMAGRAAHSVAGLPDGSALAFSRTAL